MITQDDAVQFRKNGWLKLDPFPIGFGRTLAAMVDEIQQRTSDSPWLNHYEMTDDGPKLCRTENFVPYHAGLKEFLTTGILVEIVEALMGESVHLYKEKINYKLIGGAGFRPHQDAPAYPFIKKSLSVMVAVDESTVENGCLEVCDGQHHEVLPMDERGCIDGAWTANHSWHHVEMRPGEVLFFDALTPHRSGPNTSGHDRRALFPTYNAQSEGYLRDAYYEEKMRIFNASEHTGENVRISLIDDFEGKPVS